MLHSIQLLTSNECLRNVTQRISSNNNKQSEKNLPYRYTSDYRSCIRTIQIQYHQHSLYKEITYAFYIKKVKLIGESWKIYMAMKYTKVCC